MELDDLKAAWTQYDKKLTQNLTFNEELFRNLKLEKSRKEMRTPLNYEILSVVLSVVALLFVTSWTIQYAKDLIYLISGLLSILSFIVMLAFSMAKVRSLSNIDYYNSSVIELQKALYRFKDKYFRLKRIEIILFPFYIVFLLPICAKGLRNLDLITHPSRLIITATIAIGIGLPAALWIYKHQYEKKIKNTATFLNELASFEEES